MKNADNIYREREKRPCLGLTKRQPLGIIYLSETNNQLLERKQNMDTLLAISMTATMAIVGLWLYSSFKWQGWGKI